MDNKLTAPLSTLQWVPRSKLKPNDYNPNKVSKENLKLLTQSILTNGWTLPIVVRPDFTIIDGFHRWTVAGQEPLVSMLDGYVPVVIVDHKEHSEDIYGTVTHNRAKIAMTVLADFIMLGHQKVGSFALSSDKTELFSVAISSFLDVICETFNNQGIPALIDINGDHFNGISDYPKMTHGDIEDVNVKEAGQFIKDMTGIGVLIPDDGLEDYVREIGHLPERTADSREENPERTKQQNKNEPPEDDVEEPEDEEEDEKKAEAAKRRLGM